MRTVHQVDPKAQLIVSTSHSHEDNGYTSGEDSSELDSMSLGSQVESSELKGLTTESDVLSAPKLMDGSGRVLDRPLGGLEQAVLLGWAQQVKKGTSADELQVCWMLQSGVTFHDRLSTCHSGFGACMQIWQVDPAGEAVVEFLACMDADMADSICLISPAPLPLHARA